MGQNGRATRSAANDDKIIDLVEVVSCLVGEHAIRPQETGLRTVWYGSWLLSATLHLLLFYALTAQFFFYPLVTSDKENEILWFYPTVKGLSGADVAPPVTTDTSVSIPDLVDSEVEEPATAPPDDALDVVAVASTKRIKRSSRAVATSHTTVKHPEQQTVSLPDAPGPEYQSSPSPSPPPQPEKIESPPPPVAEAVPPMVVSPKQDVSAEQQSVANASIPASETPKAEKVVAAETRHEPQAIDQRSAILQSSVTSVRHAAVSKPTGKADDKKKATHKERVSTVTVVKGTPRLAPIATTVRQREPLKPVAAPPKAVEMVKSAAFDTDKGGAVKATSSSSLQQVDRPVEKKVLAAETTKGIFVAPVRGDLKLELSGKEEQLGALSFVVAFRELPHVQRSRPQSKAAASRIALVAPKVVRSDASTVQVVVESVAAGIYYFRIQSGRLQRVDAMLSIKSYEGSTKARVQRIGERSITHNEMIVRILMPEAILWTDESAFTGNLEDSESMTKFNAATGLIWKEYK